MSLDRKCGPTRVEHRCCWISRLHECRVVGVYHRYDSGFLDFYRRQMWLYVAFIPPLRVMVNRFLGIYDMMWRYVTLEDASLLAAALAPVTLVLFGLRMDLHATSWKAVLLLVP